MHNSRALVHQTSQTLKPLQLLHSALHKRWTICQASAQGHHLLRISRSSRMGWNLLQTSRCGCRANYFCKLFFVQENAPYLQTQVGVKCDRRTQHAHESTCSHMFSLSWMTAMNWYHNTTWYYRALSRCSCDNMQHWMALWFQVCLFGTV